jgi:hypothetical protein
VTTIQKYTTTPYIYIYMYTRSTYFICTVLSFYFTTIGLFGVSLGVCFSVLSFFFKQKLQSDILLWCWSTLYFSYIVAVSFIGGGNRRTRRKPPVASHWKALSHNVVHLALIEIWTHNISGVNPTTIRPRPRRPQSSNKTYHSIL